jgi:chromosome segregation ATPase
MDLFFNLVIMSLLLVTIVYAMRLNSKLNTIRNHKIELKKNIDAFYAATEKANNAIADLQKQGKELSKELDEKVTKARSASDEIDFMLTRARKTTVSLNEGAASAVAAHQTPNFQSHPQVKIQPKTQAKTLTREQQIEQRLRAANVDIEQSRDDYMSLSEQQLLKAMRDREFKQALMG